MHDDNAERAVPRASGSRVPTDQIIRDLQTEIDELVEEE